MNREAESQRIDGLDGLRAVSVVLVILAHLSQTLPIGILSKYGNLGVSIFFFISGYVICLRMLSEETARSSFSVPGFFVRRFFRIVPPLLIYAGTVAFLGQLGLIKSSWGDLFGALTFTCNLRFVNCGWFVGHTWSLAFEEQFYLAFPVFCFFACGRVRIKVFAVLFLLCLSAAVAHYFIKLPHAWINPGHYFSLLCLGVIAGLINRKLLTEFKNRSTLIFYFSVIWLFLYFQLPPSKFLIAAHLILTPLCIGSIVLSVVARPNAWFATALGIRPMLYLGKISYGVYLWQQLFTAEPSVYFYFDLSAVWYLMFVPIVFSYHFVELPLMAIGRQFSARYLKPSW